jgi:hypothetical protein
MWLVAVADQEVQADPVASASELLLADYRRAGWACMRSSAAASAGLDAVVVA